MPNHPSDFRTQKEWIEHCIPVVMDDGTAKDNKQAFAICTNMWDRHKRDERRRRRDVNNNV